MENEKEPLVDEATTKVNEVENVQSTKVEEKSAKTFTQEEVNELLKGRFTQEQVNEIVEKRLNRKNKKQSNDAELQKIKSELNNAQIELAKKEKTIALNGYNIDSDYIDYVDYKVMRLVNKEKDYSTALKEFMETDGAKYIIGKKIEMPRPSNTDNLSSDDDAVKKIRKAMGLK